MQNEKTNVKTKFLSDRKGKRCTVLMVNGYQIKCTLIDFDDSGLTVSTTQYSNGIEKTIFVQDHAYSTVL